MEMTIDEAIGIITAKGNYSYTVIENEAKDVLVDTARKYQMVRVDYENRLKADMVAMLTEIQLEIEERFNDRPFSYNHHQRTEFYRDIDEVIQQKINALKEQKDGTDNGT